MPTASSAATAVGPAAPLPASIATFRSVRARETFPFTKPMYAGSGSRSTTRPPGALENCSRSMIARSARISSPLMVDLPTIILKPLSSGGLWLPVICTPPSRS